MAISKKRGNLEEMHDTAYKNLEEMHNILYNNIEEMTLFILFGGIYMYFERKAYDELKKWKDKYAGRYAVLLEGARRVGKSTIAENFARNEYRSYILIDFAKASKDIIECFDDISNPDIFFLRLQAVTGIDLYRDESVVIFDEVQLFPQARQAIKYLVKDGRYHYIETGSLISIKKNVQDILIPSEEMKIQVYPMDYEEFCNATRNNFSILKTIYDNHKSIGQSVNRKLMRDLRIYMAVGGMPQAVEAYVNGDNFSTIDQVKRQIINLYEDDFKKLDPSGKLSAIYHSIPAQLAKGARKFRVSSALGKKKNSSDDKLIYDLIESKTVLPSFNSTDPRVSISQTKDFDSYKLYIADTGLFVTLMFIDRPSVDNELYAKLLSDKLPANLGYLYENLVAQMINASGRELFYHTWEKKGSTHYYEIDFLISSGSKIIAIEVKSSGVGKHESLIEFRKQYSRNIKDCYVVSQKDVDKKDDIKYLPVYLTHFLC